MAKGLIVGSLIFGFGIIGSGYGYTVYESSEKTKAIFESSVNDVNATMKEFFPEERIGLIGMEYGKGLLQSHAKSYWGKLGTDKQKAALVMEHEISHGLLTKIRSVSGEASTLVKDIRSKSSAISADAPLFVINTSVNSITGNSESTFKTQKIAGGERGASFELSEISGYVNSDENGLSYSVLIPSLSAFDRANTGASLSSLTSSGNIVSANVMNILMGVDQFEFKGSDGAKLELFGLKIASSASQSEKSGYVQSSTIIELNDAKSNMDEIRPKDLNLAISMNLPERIFELLGQMGGENVSDMPSMQEIIAAFSSEGELQANIDLNGIVESAQNKEAVGVSLSVKVPVTKDTGELIELALAGNELAVQQLTQMVLMGSQVNAAMDLPKAMLMETDFRGFTSNALSSDKSDRNVKVMVDWKYGQLFVNNNMIQ